MAFLENTISQPSFDFSPIWIPLTSKEVNKQHGMTIYSGIKPIYIYIYIYIYIHTHTHTHTQSQSHPTRKQFYLYAN